MKILRPRSIRFVALLGGVVIALSAWAAAPVKAQEFTAPEKQAIEQIVRDYLLTNPEVLLEAMQALEERRRIAEETAARTAIADNADDLFHDVNSYAVGPDESDVTVVEFFDYQCGYCKRSLPALMETIESYPNVRFVFKEFPILGENSITAAKAAVASLKQGKYLEFHNAMMKNRGQLTEERVMQLADDVGLDKDQLKEDMHDPETAEILRANFRLAEALKINGTPAFIIGDTLVPGAVSQERLAQLIEEAAK